MVDQNSQFYAILTKVGAAKQANADALGIPWTITQMAVGDGNPGNVENPALPLPTETWTALLNEWRRAPLNQLKVDPNDNSILVAEQVIPADVGGRWIREIGLYDSDGDLVAVANCAPTYKPLLSQGSGRTQVVRLNLIVSSSSNVQLKIDPSVVLATREWVNEELAKQDFKHSVLVATTAAITLSGLQTIDGVALTAGARVLVKNQAAAKDNGLYLVVAGGAWTRCTDADTSAKVTPGMLVLIERGTVNADSAWQLLTDAPITLGVTALDYAMAFGRTGVVAGTYRSVQVDSYGRVVAGGNPTTVEGYGLTDVYTKTQLDVALSLTAPKDSPTFVGDPKAPTPAQFDADTSIATTAYVQRALGSLRGVAFAASGSVLGPEHVGVLLSAPSDSVFTLPLLATLPEGATFHFRTSAAAGTLGLTINTSGGEAITHAGSSNLTSLPLLRGTYAQIVKTGTYWTVINSPDNLKYDPLFAGSISPNGYQKLPSGKIEQWIGIGTPIAAGGSVSVTFPLAFPTTLLRGLAVPVNLAADSTTPASMVLDFSASTDLKTNIVVRNRSTVASQANLLLIGY